MFGHNLCITQHTSLIGRDQFDKIMQNSNQNTDQIHHERNEEHRFLGTFAHYNPLRNLTLVS